MSDVPTREIAYPGPPTKGSFNLGDVVIDSTGTLWKCTKAGSASLATFVEGSGAGVTSVTSDTTATVTVTPNGTGVKVGVTPGTFVPTAFIPLNVKGLGAKGDGILLFDGAITSGTNAFTSATSLFTQADVGKTIAVQNANTGPSPLCTTIAAVTGLGAATLSTNANRTVSAQEFVYGTDDTTALQAAVTAVTAKPQGGTLYSPYGFYLTTAQITAPNVIGTNGPLRLTGDNYTYRTLPGFEFGATSGTVWRACNNTISAVFQAGTSITGHQTIIEGIAFDAAFSASASLIIDSPGAYITNCGTFRALVFGTGAIGGFATFQGCNLGANGGVSCVLIDGTTNPSANTDNFFFGCNFFDGTSGITTQGATADLYVTGCHFYPSSTGHNIVIAGSANSITLVNNVFEDVIGDYIVLQPSATHAINNVVISDNMVFTNQTGFTDNTFSFVRVDTSASTSQVVALTVDGNSILGGPGHQWKSMVNFVGTGASTVSVSNNNGLFVNAFWTGGTPDGNTSGNTLASTSTGTQGPTGDMPFSVVVTTNAGTVPINHRLVNFTNTSAATMAITIATANATDGQKLVVRVYDFSAAAQTIGWTNTENSLTSVPATSNGSTTLPLTVGFMFNGATSKWRCLAVS